jgi:hypothetical protein
MIKSRTYDMGFADGVTSVEDGACCRARKRLEDASPNDIRGKGWSVAVHNDYRMGGIPHTFWLFTKDGRAVKGEGLSDAEALDQVRKQIGFP